MLTKLNNKLNPHLTSGKEIVPRRNDPLFSCMKGSEPTYYLLLSITHEDQGQAQQWASLSVATHRS